jgi:hypothetical protein
MPDVIEVVVASQNQVEFLDDAEDIVEVLTIDETVVEVVVEGPQGPEPTVAASIHYIFDGGGQVITTGMKGSIIVPFACTINSWTLVANPSGSIAVDIWKTPLAGYPPADGDSITGGAEPAIVAAQSASSASLGAWDTAVSEGDILAFNVDSVTDVTLASIALKVTRT